MSNDLKILFPDREVLVGNELVKVKKFKLGQYPKVIEIAAELAPLIVASKGDILSIATMGAENVIQLASLSCGKPRKWFDEVEPDEGIPLLTAVLEVNWSYFEKKVKPQLAGMLAAFKSLNEKAVPPTPEAGESSGQD